MKKNIRQNNKGFAMLFTVVIVSAVSVITAGLTNTIYKQMILSSLARDSQIAFYQADTASDCALYADFSLNRIEKNPEYFTNPEGTLWSCGSVSGENNLIIKPDGEGFGGYTIEPSDIDEESPCFKIEVKKDLEGAVEVHARGYNICDPTNPRTVEREIETNYKQ